MTEPLIRTLETITHGRFLVIAPDGAPPAPLLVGFHGYAETAGDHLRQLQRIAGTDRWLLVSVQGLNRFYSGRTEQVVANWMTRQDRELAIADNLAYVDRVVSLVSAERRTNRLVFAGFSQGVAMAFRAAVLGPHKCQGVIALGGDVPPDLHDAAPARFPPVLLGRGRDDTWYTAEKLDADVELLKRKNVEVTAVTFGGAHEWTEEFRDAAGRFLARVQEATRD